ncbi:DUF805 domain-containing protein [Castellaniella sp.]|uniref:DUF805 domain-containing protein n=1 Tax=Castellaniella sp. TaxID=1955812 RepID=UPI002AFE88B1|nr:DUF805 domain-containing protein [Castellaniella sp.]
MKGSVLDFSIQQGQGIITTEEGRRYTFVASEWKGQDHPKRGQAVDFDVSADGEAVGVYIALGSTTSSMNAKLQSAISSLDGKARSSYNPFDWFILAFKNYANFKGRAERQEYWFYILFYFIGILGLSVIDEILFGVPYSDFGLLSSVFMLASLMPTVALSARRLHDLGKSGWWQLLSIIPVIGTIILIIWFATKGQDVENAYGVPVSA